jgi:hypothetical protein
MTDGQSPPVVRLFDAATEKELTEAEYFELLRQIFALRNPHLVIEETLQTADEEDDSSEP